MATAPYRILIYSYQWLTLKCDYKGLALSLGVQHNDRVDPMQAVHTVPTYW